MIVINARFLGQEQHGAQRFAEQIGLQLKQQRDDLLFVAPHGIRDSESSRTLAAQRIGINGGPLWEQLDLPLWLARHGKPLLLSLGSSAPLAYDNQIVTQHDMAHLHYPQGFTAMARLGYRLLLPRMLKKARGLITVSEFSRQQITERYRCPAGRIRVIHDAPAAIFRPAANEPMEQTRYLLAVSPPRPHKNLERLIDAFLGLKGCDDVELRIVDGGIGITSVPDFVPLANPRIRVLGHLSDEKLAEQYRGAVALVCPSLYEGFGLPPLEAQACGCPVVAASIPAMLEVLGDSALYFDPLDSAQIALCMRRVLHEAPLRANLRERGLDNARRYSWEDSARQVSELIDATLAQLGNPSLLPFEHPARQH